MKAVILAGGLGTRISEESHLRPKPMIEIGGRPILWHIMKGYAQHGVHDFVICVGYKGYLIKEFFANYRLHRSDVTIDLGANMVTFERDRAEPWRVTLADTGENTMTGGRLLRVRKYLREDEPFLLTYGDGLADLELHDQLAFHRKHGRLATMTVVRPPARFGAAVLQGDRVARFQEAGQADGGFINGGFFVLEPAVLDRIDGDDTPWELAPLERLIAEDQVVAWRHERFWQPMDTLRDREYLEQLWADGRAPWKTWS